MAENAFENERFNRFLQEVDDIVKVGGGEERITQQVASALETLLEMDLQLPDEYRKPREDRYVMYPLYVAPDSSWSVASAVWNIGQSTPVHDHGVWGVVGIAEGIERETRYLKPPDTDAVTPLTKLPNEDFSPGQVTICCTTDADIHSVSCESDIPVVGIHVYGGDIGRIKRRTYAPDSGEVGYFTSTWPDIPPAVQVLR